MRFTEAREVVVIVKPFVVLVVAPHGQPMHQPRRMANDFLHHGFVTLQRLLVDLLVIAEMQRIFDNQKESEVNDTRRQI